MDAKELRIGNLIYNEYTKQVQEVYPEMITQLSRLGIENNMKPIPITEDWLLNFGFIKSHNNNGDTYHILDEGGITCMFTVEHWNTVKNDSKWFNHWHVTGLLKGNKLKQVHQLQNLYFSLTNEELKQ